MDAFAKQIAFLEQHSNYARRWLSAKPEWRSWLQSMGPREITLAGIQGLLESCKVDGLEVEQDEAQFTADFLTAKDLDREKAEGARGSGRRFIPWAIGTRWRWLCIQ